MLEGHLSWDSNLSWDSHFPPQMGQPLLTAQMGQPLFNGIVSFQMKGSHGKQEKWMSLFLFQLICKTVQSEYQFERVTQGGGDGLAHCLVLVPSTIHTEHDNRGIV
jgi:hypothetical protein